MKQEIDLAITYKFLKNLVTPFEKWPAYKLGLIDKDGKVVESKIGAYDSKQQLFDQTEKAFGIKL